MDAGVVLGVIAAATAVGSLIFTAFAWKTERRDREQQIAAQLTFERERIEAEREERQRQRRADITATQLEIEDAGDDEHRIYSFTLTNMGPSYSKYVSAYLVDQEGRVRSSRPNGRPLDAGASREIALHVPRIAWEPPAPLRLVVRWHGEDGKPHEEVTNLTVQHEIHPQL